MAGPPQLRTLYLSDGWGRCRYTSGIIRRIEEEIKASLKVDDDINILKAQAATEYCRSRGFLYNILTELDIGYSRKFPLSIMTDTEKRERKKILYRKRRELETAEEREKRKETEGKRWRKWIDTKDEEWHKERNYKYKSKRKFSVASFAETGTNVPTGMVKIIKS